MNKPWQPYAHHILDTIAKIRLIEARGSIVEDAVLYDAALRNFQTLSEAAGRLPEERQILCSDIPWREISGFRNILVHNYLGDIDPLTVARVIEEYLPALETCVRILLAEDENN